MRKIHILLYTVAFFTSALTTLSSCNTDYNPTDAIANDDAYEARIMQERRVEFVGEGLRWYDLRRWFNRDAAGKEAVLKLRCYQANETAGSRPTASDAMNISEDGHELLWPIPTVARDNDSALP